MVRLGIYTKENEDASLSVTGYLPKKKFRKKQESRIETLFFQSANANGTGRRFAKKLWGFRFLPHDNFVKENLRQSERSYEH